MAHVSQNMQECIDRCDECRHECLSMLDHCLEKGGPHAEPEHIRLLVDCAEICQTSANFMSRGSDHHSETCDVCAEVCEACAESCEAISDDAELARCAEACRTCAQSCREMATAAA
jgi:hypothetical protein